MAENVNKENESYDFTKVITGLNDAVDEIIKSKMKELDSYYMETITALQTEIAEMNLAYEKQGNNVDRSFIMTYQESLDKAKEKYKKKYGSDENFNEALFTMASGGYIEYSEEEHEWFIKAAREKERYSPIVRNIRNLIVNAVLASELKVDIPHEETDEAITKILEKNNFSERLKRWISTSYIDSEIFPFVHFGNKGNIKIREVDPLEIIEIIRHPQDADMVMGYKREYEQLDHTVKTKYYKDYNTTIIEEDDSLDPYQWPYPSSDTVDNSFMLWFKYGARNRERGELPLAPVMRWERIYEDIVIDLARLYHERAKVIWLLKITGNKSSQLDRNELPVKSGTIKLESENRTWRIEDPKLTAQVSENYGNPHRSMIAAGAGIPTHLVFMDSSSQSYASLRHASSPFNSLIKSIQYDLTNFIKYFIRIILVGMVERGQLPTQVEIEQLPQQDSTIIVAEVLSMVAKKQENFEEYNLSENLDKLLEEIKNEGVSGKKAEKKKVKVSTIDLPINIIFPKQESDNPLILAQAINVLVQSKVLSLRTARKMLGLDPSIEAALVNFDFSIPYMGGKSEQPEKNTARKVDRGQYGSE
ncbi:MAG: hypothetical protein PHC29_08635 [Candidatus Omnitrophica bacterium]|nr:hypothetical protein [Candidatus Omnitrophota bacterium]